MNEECECEVCGWTGPVEHLEPNPDNSDGYGVCPACGSGRVYDIDLADFEEEP